MKIKLLLITTLIIAFSGGAHAVCKGSMLNPITDVSWNCMLPIRIAGVSLGSSGDPLAKAADDAIGAKTPVCFCMEGIFPRFGITLGMNEVIRYVEVVKDPYCMAALGFSLYDTGGLYGGTGGVDVTRNASGLTYYQTHYTIFLPFLIMNLFTDLICLQDGTTGNPLTIAYMSELEGVADGSNSSSVAAMLNPETVLFANPVMSMYCMGDAVLTAAEFSDVAGYWCAGGHVIYPLSNFEDQGVDYTDAASIVAAKVVFKMVRYGGLLECTSNQGMCKCFPIPIWNKMSYRFQMAKPLPDRLCRRIGKPFMLWGEYPSKNPPYIISNDNLVFLLWRHRECCAF